MIPMSLKAVAPICMPRILLTVPLFMESRYMLQQGHNSTQMPSKKSWVAGESSPQWDAPQRKWTIWWGLVFQKVSNRTESKTHRGAGCACYGLCKQRSAQQDNCGRVTLPGSTSYHLGRNYNAWGAGREDNESSFTRSVPPVPCTHYFLRGCCFEEIECQVLLYLISLNVSVYFCRRHADRLVMLPWNSLDFKHPSGLMCLWYLSEMAEPFEDGGLVEGSKSLWSFLGRGLGDIGPIFPFSLFASWVPSGK